MLKVKKTNKSEFKRLQKDFRSQRKMNKMCVFVAKKDKLLGPGGVTRCNETGIHIFKLIFVFLGHRR